MTVFKQKCDGWGVGRNTRRSHFRTAHLAHVHLVSVLARRGAVGGEDGRAVAVGVAVDQADGIVQSFCLQDHQHGPEDLLGVALHVRLPEQRRSHAAKFGGGIEIEKKGGPGDTHRDAADDGGTHKVAILVTFDFDVPAVQQHLCTLVQAALDQTADSVLGLHGDQRPNICTGLVS